MTENAHEDDDLMQTTPADELFEGESIVLSGGRFQDKETRQWTFTEVTFSIRYYFYSKSVQISIYDMAERYKRVEEEVTDFATAKVLIEQIAADYHDKVQAENYIPKLDLFFQASPGSVSIDSRVTDTSGSCGQCGDYNTDRFNFDYVPAVPNSELDKSSLSLRWDYGCYGGEEIAGVFEEVAPVVREMLSRMLEWAQDEYKTNILEAIAVISPKEEHSH